MWTEKMAWMRMLVEDVQRQALARTLHGLSDHLLADIGLRRDQLDLLRSRPAKTPVTRAGSLPSRAVRPSIRGCG